MTNKNLQVSDELYYYCNYSRGDNGAKKEIIKDETKLSWVVGWHDTKISKKDLTASNGDGGRVQYYTKDGLALYEKKKKIIKLITPLLYKSYRLRDLSLENLETLLEILQEVN